MNMKTQYIKICGTQWESCLEGNVYYSMLTLKKKERSKSVASANEIRKKKQIPLK